jgi:DNA-binding winged helix-turn-helix (wHTH) protein
VAVKARFSDCRLDTDARRVWRGTREIHLSPKAFELLKALVENRHRALSKAEAVALVWPGVFVSDASLARVVCEIREGIGDRGREGRIVRTVHGYGYAFAADLEGIKEETLVPARSVPGGSVCWLIRGNRTFPLADGEHVAGREPDMSVWLDSPKVSRRHARLVVNGANATIEDLGSKNGTFVGDLRISAPTALQPGDEVHIGPFTLVFRTARGSSTTATETQSA